jgi:hypothetical protein
MGYETSNFDLKKQNGQYLMSWIWSQFKKEAIYKYFGAWWINARWNDFCTSRAESITYVIHMQLGTDRTERRYKYT